MNITHDLIRDAIADSSDEPILVSPIDLRNARPAGVVVPIVLHPEPSILLVLRGKDLRDHAGEVGFPGGKPEPHDVDLRATAAREMLEEIAVAEASATWLGKLAPCPVITGRYMIHPFVAALHESASPRSESSEVSRIITMPILPFLEGTRPIHAIEGMWREQPMRTPFFRLDDVVLYGASAYIAYDLLARIAARQGRALPALTLTSELPWGDRYAST